MTQLPKHLQERIEQDARVARQEYVKEELGMGTPASSVKYMGIAFKEGFEDGAEALYSLLKEEKGEVAGVWRTPEEKMPPVDREVIVEFKSGDLQSYTLTIEAAPIRKWWIRNVRRWLDTSTPIVAGCGEMVKALEVARAALASSYDVNDHPGDGGSDCDKAIKVIDEALKQHPVK